jgi:hypothetical protein
MRRYQDLIEKEWNAKFKEWKRRNWMAWLEERLIFPFEAVYSEEGKCVKVLGLVDFDPGDVYGVVVQVQRGRQMLELPLCDLAVIPKTGPNHGPVQEFADYWANG